MFGFGRKTLRFKTLDFVEEDIFRVGGLTFNTSTTDYSRKTTDQEIVLLKNKGMLDTYRGLFGGKPIRNILEFGTWEGGSPLYFVAGTNIERFVGIDLRDPIEPVLKHAERFGDRLKLVYSTSQSDRSAVTQAINDNFDGPIDLIIDDASHMYEHTKASFDIAFPRLRVGGLYIIEDWNWAHYPDRHFDDYFQDQPALSNLAMELVMAVGSLTQVASLEVHRWCLIVRKDAEVPADFSLDKLIRMGERRTYTPF